MFCLWYCEANPNAARDIREWRDNHIIIDVVLSEVLIICYILYYMEFNSYYFELSFVFFLLSNISFELQPARLLFTPHIQLSSAELSSISIRDVHVRHSILLLYSLQLNERMLISIFVIYINIRENMKIMYFWFQIFSIRCCQIVLDCLKFLQWLKWEGQFSHELYQKLLYCLALRNRRN